MNTNQHDLSDEEFDDLFRNAADKIDLDFDADSWTKMSQKLDAVSPPTPTVDKTSTSWSKWGLPVLGLLLLLSIGSYFAIEYSSKKPATNPTELKDSPANQREANEAKSLEADKVDTSTPASTTDKVVSEKPVKEESINSSNPTTSLDRKPDKTNELSKVPAKVEKVAIIEQHQASTNSLLPKKTERSNETQTKKVSKEANQLANNNKVIKTNETPEASVKNVSANNTTKEKRRVSASNTSAVEKNDSKESQQVEKNNSLANTNAIDKPSDAIKADNAPLVDNSPISTDNQETLNKWELTGANALSSKAVNYTINLNLPEVAFESPQMAPMAPVRENTLFNRGFNLRLALSPDFSTVGLTDIVKIGHNWAVLGEYRFNKRLSLQTGVIKSLKYYSALPESYELPYSGTYTPALKDIDATCNMLDIPLNLRYDLSQRPNNRWFVSGGFTSYVMLNEKYNYNYQDPTNPNIKWWKWEGKTGAYPFSVFNLSLGFEQQLFRRLSFQAEPFLKMPLGKVGYGKVRLATVGVFFSLKYPLTKF